MLINERKQAEEVLSVLAKSSAISFDTETTGLYPHHGDTFFALIMSTGSETYYFDFNSKSKKHLSTHDLDLFSELFSQKRLWIAHKMKFDREMLATKGIYLSGTFHCTLTMERLLDSLCLNFDLDAVASRYGYQKLNTVSLYIRGHQLTSEVVDISTGKKEQKQHYDDVPIDIMYQYGIRDAQITYRIHEKQLEAYLEQGLPDELYEMEMALNDVVFHMEHCGIRVDPNFLHTAYINGTISLGRQLASFKGAYGVDYVDSNKAMTTLFEHLKDRWVYGDKTVAGNKNPSFDKSWLQKMLPDQRAQDVLGIRQAKSNLDYIEGMSRVRDSRDHIHTNLNQHGASTGRFSSSAPNTQNLTRNREGADNIRSAIVPLHEGWWLASIDYDQIEYRLAMDYAGCPHMTKAILGGLDVHEAMAQIVGIKRQEAKAVNFGIIYGSGDQALADSLSISLMKAKELKAAIFHKSPALSRLLQDVMHKADVRGYISTWLGRKLRFPVYYDKFRIPRKTSYKAPNGLCQGGAADIMKMAMVKVSKFLAPLDTKMILTVHDELILSGPPDEEHIIDAVTEIMSKVYKSRFIPITASAKLTYTNLSEMKEYVGYRGKVRGVQEEAGRPEAEEEGQASTQV